jgi:transposase
VVIRAPSGRQRFNVLGALDAVSHELITITNETYITATTVCQLLEQLAHSAGGSAVTVVLDNARYQRCKLVMQRAVELNLELLFLPAYSPNLNLIERLWRFVRKECLYAKYYESFERFKQAISNCLAETQGRHHGALKSLLSLEFQTLKPATFDL